MLCSNHQTALKSWKNLVLTHTFLQFLISMSWALSIHPSLKLLQGKSHLFSCRKYSLSMQFLSQLQAIVCGSLPVHYSLLQCPSSQHPACSPQINHHLIKKRHMSSKLLTCKSSVRSPSALHHWQTYQSCKDKLSFEVGWYLDCHKGGRQLVWTLLVPRQNNIPFLLTMLQSKAKTYHFLFKPMVQILVHLPLLEYYIVNIEITM